MHSRRLFLAVMSIAAAAVFATEPATEAPQAIRVARMVDTLARAEHAITEYVAAWASRDAQQLSRVMTDDAVVDFALDEPGTYLTVEASSLISDCASCTPSLDSQTRVSNVHVFPTHDQNAVFVQFDTTSDYLDGASRTQTQLALVELRGNRIAHIRNFAAPPVSIVVKNEPPRFIRPADRAQEIALR